MILAYVCTRIWQNLRRLGGIAVAIWSIRVCQKIGLQDARGLMIDHHFPVLHVVNPCNFLHHWSDLMISHLAALAEAPWPRGPGAPTWKSSALLRNRKTCSATCWTSPSFRLSGDSFSGITQPPAGGSAQCLRKKNVGFGAHIGDSLGWSMDGFKGKHVGTPWNNRFLHLTHTVEGWSQSNFLECGQTACGKVATTGSQQGHGNPSKHKGIAFIWRIQSTIITNTREPTPRTADYSSASTALHYKQSFCHNGLIWEGVRPSERRKQWKEKKQQSVRKKEKKIKQDAAHKPECSHVC